jgi:branched-chain amino acid transport system ATP-binding protein
VSESNPSTLLVARDVTKSFAGFIAVDNVTLTVPAGGIHAVIGPNGAGKSTLFGMIAGSVRPTAGKIVFDGRNVTKVPTWRRSRMGISRAFQVARFFPTFTVAENVRGAVLAQRRESWKFYRYENSAAVAESVERSLEAASLDDIRDVQARTLSQGDRKRLELALATAMRPKLLLLDEPTAGMSPVETAETIALIRLLQHETGCTVLLTEHDMSVIFTLADTIAVMNHGEIIAEGPPDTIGSDERVIEAYLGESFAP